MGLLVEPGGQTVALVNRWSGKRDSNPRPRAWKARALPTELFPLIDTPLMLRSAQWRGEDSNLRRHKPADLQSAPFGRSGTSPYVNQGVRIILSYLRCAQHQVSRWAESNRQPTDYKSVALPIELHRQKPISNRYYAATRLSTTPRQPARPVTDLPYAFAIGSFFREIAFLKNQDRDKVQATSSLRL